LNQAPLRILLSLQAEIVREAETWNIVGDIPGNADAEEQVIVGAHWDGHDRADAAMDNALGGSWRSAAVTPRAVRQPQRTGPWSRMIAITITMLLKAAVIGVKHPKWDERPIVVAVKKPGQDVSREELLRFYEGKIAKWWMPDDVVFVNELPHTATGKLSKLTLRQQFKDYRLDQK
jgi:hypothetical protein